MPGRERRGKYEHERLMDPEICDSRSFRTKPIKPGVKAVVCCPKGKWSPSKNVCKVGMKLQKLEREI